MRNVFFYCLANKNNKKTTSKQKSSCLVWPSRISIKFYKTIWAVWSSSSVTYKTQCIMLTGEKMGFLAGVCSFQGLLITVWWEVFHFIPSSILVLPVIYYAIQDSMLRYWFCWKTTLKIALKIGCSMGTITIRTLPLKSRNNFAVGHVASCLGLSQIKNLFIYEF